MVWGQVVAELGLVEVEVEGNVLQSVEVERELVPGRGEVVEGEREVVVVEEVAVWEQGAAVLGVASWALLQKGGDEEQGEREEEAPSSEGQATLGEL